MTAQQQKQFNLNILKKCRFSFWASLGLVVVLTLVKLVLSNRSVTWGRQLEAMKAETEAIRSENDRLRLQLNQQTGGLDQLKEKALSLGFVAKPAYVYFTGKERVAQKLP